MLEMWKYFVMALMLFCILGLTSCGNSDSWKELQRELQVEDINETVN